MPTNRKSSATETLSRRDFLKLIPPVLLAGFWSSRNIANVQAMSAKPGINLSGKNFKGWKMDLGDALYSRPEDAPVDITDIETVHLKNYSELRANIKQRIIMAHNITYKRIINDNLINYKHECAYQFKLPYLPHPVGSDLWNAQTLEGGLFIWDGADTRLDYGTAFQWDLNPWGEFGAVRIWTADGDAGQWTTVGNLTPDTNWHHVNMVVNVSSEMARLKFDDTQYSVYLSKTTKPDTWGTEVAARLQAEIVSIYPEPSGIQAAHKAQFRNWRWRGKPIHSH
jgi:hypothetical protein